MVLPEEGYVDEFDRYAMNDIPIRLIRLIDMTFVERNDVREHFRTSYIKRLGQPSDTVRYAILSHRWLNQGEPTYEEIRAGTAAGPGYEKLKKFCAKAEEYNMEFAWSDTCCINKNSSTELDESIRSMFRWYGNSAICIVHLAQSETIEDMMEDEWTERGWTLQELLAPARIKFFNKYWVPMTGDRNDKDDKDDINEFLVSRPLLSSLRRREPAEILETLERATGIPYDDLRRKFCPSPSEVDKRMTWAARRKTTRVEDVAYSLMGMFDVSLQIAYGEGGDRAFCRLIEVIMQAGDPSVLNWKGEAARHHTSRAIPRSPQSFIANRSLEFEGSGQLEMTMTSLGLRVPLVIFPLSVRSNMRAGHGYSITLDCPLCPSIKVDIDTSCRLDSIDQYALGIVNYSLIGHVPGIRGKSAGFILHRAPDVFHCVPVCKPNCTAFVGLKFSPPEERFAEWKLVEEVGLVQVDFPIIPDEPVCYIDRQYLQTVYL
ncbi:hypothetical protein CY34DRAFT_813772 [Suillus luteus UH-Slu-Lm8-n1]|uniref:Heterokaryon incompatibility domain-containing protein n=1 Tax=Suillus luteus UH-Slu-Lm8-n1 TaxID=930992 RepID=A0A0C9Z6T5_9AGAM|nr:hypothetical protein CY34DRAFT_813772 [Suillus luteus UH-Slu-Lm8-n1]